jgi:Eukaryotic cytochrome b561
MIITPAAVLVARLGRHLQGTWLKLHQWVQVIVTFAFTVAAVVVAVVASNEPAARHTSAGHKILGFALLVVFLVQLVLGWIIHHLFTPSRTKRPVRNIAHMGLGILLVLLGFGTVGSGFGTYYRSTPAYIIAIFVVLIVFFVLFYLASLGFLVHNRHQMGGRPWREAAFGLGRNDTKVGQQTPGDWARGPETLEDRTGGRTEETAAEWPRDKANVVDNLEMQPSSFQWRSRERDGYDGYYDQDQHQYRQHGHFSAARRV